MIEYDRYHLNRCDALEFLANNFDRFPECMPELVREVAPGISENIYKGWMFIVLEDGELVFADCLSPCIRARDFDNIFTPSEDL